MPEQKLISISDLLSSGWSQFLKDWRRLFEISVRFVLAGLLVLAGALFSERVMPNATGDLIAVLASLGSVVITLHAAILLMDYVIKREEKHEGEIPSDSKRAWTLFLPFLWIGILNFFAVLGGFILLIIPGIWLSILFSFSTLYLIDENRRGTKALAASAALVKGRWWATLWRLLVPSLIVSVLAFLLTFALMLILGLIIGFDRVFDFARETQPMQTGNGTVEAVSTMISSLIQIALVPLSTIYQVKLYRSLKATR